LAAINIDTAESLSALDTENRTKSTVPRWVVDDELVYRAESYVFGRLEQIFSTLPESRRSFAPFKHLAFVQARRDRVRELRQQRISAFERAISVVGSSRDEREEELEDMELYLHYGELIEFRELLEDPRRFGELATSLLEAEREALADDDSEHDSHEEL
jgi:hypothetical protein